MRDAFGIDEIGPSKVGLTADQVVDFELPPKLKTKATSVNYGKIVVEHSNAVFEPEALSPEDLQAVLKETIGSVIDIDAFTHKPDQEREDAVFWEVALRRGHTVLSGIGEGQ